MVSRIVFLDLDGVLNSNDFYAREGLNCRPPFDPLAVLRLDRLCREAQADVVLSSSWRGASEIPGWLCERGFGGCVIGRTPTVAGIRGREIAKWIIHADIEIAAFCILDDGDDMGELLPYLIQTTQEHGLQDEHVDRAISMLGRMS